MKTRVCLKYFVCDCLCKLLFASDLPQALSNGIYFIIFVILRPLTQFSHKIRATYSQKVLKLVLLDNYFSDLLIKV